LSPFGVVPVGVVFPPRRVQTEPLTTPVASLMGSHRSRGMRLREGRQDRPHRVRVNEARCRSNPGCLPSSKDRRPATPSRAPGFGLRLHCDLAAAMQEIDAFSPLLPLASHQEPVSRPRVPLPPETRFSEPRRSLPTSATIIDTRAHPTSVRPSHASEAFASLLAGINGCRLRWYPPCVAARGTCEPQSAREGFRFPRSTCVDESDRGSKHPSKGKSRDRGRFACALLMVHRAPGSPNRVVVRSG